MWRLGIPKEAVEKPSDHRGTVSETLIETGIATEALAVVRSIQVATGDYIDKPALETVKGKTKNTLLGISLGGTIIVEKVKNLIRSTKGSARDFFKGLFESEYKESVDLGMESETIGTEAGIWGLEVPIKGKPSIKEAQGKIQKGIEAYVKKTETNLLKIYNQNKNSRKLDFEFEDRLAPQNIKTWLRVVGQYREAESRESVKDINSQVSKGIIQKRKDSQVDKAFQVVICRSVADLEQARNFSKMADEQPVAKVIMFVKNDKDKGEYVDRIETWQPHFTMNGSQGVDFLTHITENQGIETEERDIGRNQILREKPTPQKEEVKAKLYDVSIDYKTTLPEELLKEKAVSSIKPRMKKTVLQMASWLSLTRDKSGYICIDPQDDLLSNSSLKTGEERKPAPAELQLAFIVAGVELDELYDRTKGELKRKTKDLNSHTNMIKQILGIGGEARQTADLAVANAWKALNSTNILANDEFERSSQGRGTIATLSAHLPELARGFFKLIYSKEDKLVSGGSIQLSKIKGGKLKGVRFRSALNLHTDASAAEIQFGEGENMVINNNYRVRTDAQTYIRTKKELEQSKSSPGVPVTDTEIKEVILLETRKKIAEQRKMQVILSLLMVSRDKSISVEELAKAIKMSYEAFTAIDLDMKLLA